MQKIILSVVLMVCLGFLSNVCAQEEEKSSGREFKLFDWKISLDKEEDRKTSDELEDAVEKYIRTTTNEKVARERDRVRREKDRIEKKRERDIERAEWIKDKEINEAREKAEARIERAKRDSTAEIEQMEGNLRTLALEEMKIENRRLPPEPAE